MSRYLRPRRSAARASAQKRSLGFHDGPTWSTNRRQTSGQCGELASPEPAMPSPASLKKRQSIIAACLEMNARGLNQGTSGNISLREGDGLLITPTSMAYDAMKPGDIVAMRLDGSVIGAGRPSSEWRFHLDILRERPDVGAVVHAHPNYCTTLAIMERSIPPDPLHDRRRRRRQHPLRALRDLRHRGIVRQRRRGSQGQESLSSRPSRHDRGRRLARAARCGSRSRSRPSRANMSIACNSAIRRFSRRRKSTT